MGALTTYQQGAQPRQEQQLVRPDYGVLGSLAGGLGMYTLGNQYLDSMNSNQAGLANMTNTGNADIDKQIASLSHMYDPNSPYALQLKQELARKDAAAGRNSQYGTRQVELQARLAALQAQNAGTIGNMVNQKIQNQQHLATSGNQNGLAQAQVQAQQLASLFNVGDKTGLLQHANNGLSGLFGTPNVNTATQEGYGNTMGGGLVDHQGGGYFNLDPSTAYGGSTPDFGGQSGVSGLYVPQTPDYASNGASFDPNNSYTQPPMDDAATMYPWGE